MNKEIPYSNDINCIPILRKYHSTGYRHIYSVEMIYRRKGSDSKRTLTMDYGSFRIAHDRYDMEYSMSYSPDKWILDEISLTGKVYKDTELITKDVMIRSKYNPYFQEFSI